MKKRVLSKDGPKFESYYHYRSRRERERAGFYTYVLILIGWMLAIGVLIGILILRS